MTVPRRTVRDIRTLSGRVGQIGVPYRAYMRISCLEMERFRRNQEKSSASNRIALINQRMREIDDEKARLLKGMGEGGAGAPSPPYRGASSIPGVSSIRRGLRIKY